MYTVRLPTHEIPIHDFNLAKHKTLEDKIHHRHPIRRRDSEDANAALFPDMNNSAHLDASLNASAASHDTTNSTHAAVHWHHKEHGWIMKHSEFLFVRGYKAFVESSPDVCEKMIRNNERQVNK